MTSVLLAIPMHNYSEGVVRILKWASESEVLRGIDWTTAVYNDRSREGEIAVVKETLRTLPEENRRFDVQDAPEGLNLQFAIHQAGTVGVTLGIDAVLIAESDAVPDDETLRSMLAVYKDPVDGWIQPDISHYRRVFRHGSRIDDAEPQLPNRFGMVASVSPVYTWRGHYCYPTQWKRPDWNWLQVNESGDCYQIQESEHGRVGMARAVPFLFSLWNPVCLSKVDFTHMPKLHHLDTALGAACWNDGYINLRLLDRHIEHQDGGKKSR